MEKPIVAVLKGPGVKKLIASVLAKSDDLKNITTVDLANLLDVSERQLTRICKNSELPAPQKLVQEFKIEQAKKLLEELADITLVAERSGFKTVAAFRKAFKKYTGVPVSEYRKNHTNQKANIAIKIKKYVLKAAIRGYKYDGFDVKAFADKVEVSERTLNRMCHEHFELTPWRLIHTFRIKRAKRLVALGYENKDIVSLAGFNSIAGFRAAFVREVGVTPDSFRYANNRDIKEYLETKIKEYLGDACNLKADSEVKIALREKLNVLLPQKPNLLESLESSASDHEIVGLLIDYLVTMK